MMNVKIMPNSKRNADEFVVVFGDMDFKKKDEKLVRKIESNAWKNAVLKEEDVPEEQRQYFKFTDGKIVGMENICSGSHTYNTIGSVIYWDGYDEMPYVTHALATAIATEACNEGLITWVTSQEMYNAIKKRNPNIINFDTWLY